MSIMDLKFYLHDRSDDREDGWALQVSTFESMPRHLVCVSAVEVDPHGEPVTESGPALWVDIEDLRRTLDQVDAAMKAVAQVPGPADPDDYPRVGSLARFALSEHAANSTGAE